MPIHPTAIVDRHAELDPSAEVGAYAIIEPGAVLHAGVQIFPHAFIARGTTLRARAQVHPFAVVGHVPQDLAFKGEPSFADIGEGTIVREHVTIHRGTMPGSTTVVGRNCFFMSTSHVGHNCHVGDEVKLANGALLAGHVHVGARAFISGNSVVHQFVRIGELVMLGGSLRVVQDVVPFVLLGPDSVGLNTIGMRRAGISSVERLELRECHRLLFRSGLMMPAAIERIAGLVRTESGKRLLEFLRAPSKRGIELWRGRRAQSEAPPED